jgi:amino acid transporter
LDYASFGILFLTGFTACAEFGSYAFVHPIIRELPQKYHIQVERGLLRTFGRVMPVLMTLSAIVAVGYALNHSGANDYARLTRWIAATFLVAALAFTIIFNVPINLATGKWNPDNPPPNWKETRNRWERFQAIRSWLLLLGFASICVAVSLKG